MTEVEVEAETTQIETETVTVCDACGRPADTDSHTLAIDPPSSTDIPLDPGLAHELAQRTQPDVMVEEGPTPRTWDLTRLSSGPSLTTDIDYDDTVDICADCFETTFDAVVDEADIQLLTDAHEESDDEEDEEEAKGFRPKVVVAVSGIGAIWLSSIHAAHDQALVLMMLGLLAVFAFISGEVVDGV